MGSTINAWIEYDEHGDPPFFQEADVLPLTEWDVLYGAKDYQVYGALSGVRNATEKEPLFKLRGLPFNPSSRVREKIGNDASFVSWLFPSEVIKALAHHGVTDEVISLEMSCVFKLLEFMASNIGEERVRFVFETQ